MGIDELCGQDSAAVLVDSNAGNTGPTFGPEPNYVPAGSISCLVQTASAGESLGYSARGMKVDYFVFCSTDPKLTKANALKWTDEAGVIHFLRILATDNQGRPGETLLWILLCEEITSRLGP